MSTEVLVVKELFRNFENALHDRLKVMEDILTRAKQGTVSEDNSTLLSRIQELEGHFRSLDEYAMGQVRTLAYNHDMLEKRVESIESSLKSAVESFRTINDTIGMMQKRIDDNKPVEVAEVEAEIEETQEAALNADEEAVVIEQKAQKILTEIVDQLTEEEEEEEDEEEDEEEEEPYDHIFTYQGNDYYVHKETNNVYIPDEDGTVDEDAVVGIWNPETEKLWIPDKKKWWDYKTNKYVDTKAKK